MADTDFMQQLAISVKDMITTCAEDLLKVYPTPEGPKVRSSEEIQAIVSSMQEDIQSLTDDYMGGLLIRGMITPDVIRQCGDELKMINERMVLDLHARLRSELGSDLWPPMENI